MSRPCRILQPAALWLGTAELRLLSTWEPIGCSDCSEHSWSGHPLSEFPCVHKWEPRALAPEIYTCSIMIAGFTKETDASIMHLYPPSWARNLDLLSSKGGSANANAWPSFAKINQDASIFTNAVSWKTCIGLGEQENVLPYKLFDAFNVQLLACLKKVLIQ